MLHALYCKLYLYCMLYVFCFVACTCIVCCNFVYSDMEEQLCGMPEFKQINQINWGVSEVITAALGDRTDSIIATFICSGVQTHW